MLDGIQGDFRGEFSRLTYGDQVRLYHALVQVMAKVDRLSKAITDLDRRVQKVERQHFAHQAILQWIPLESALLRTGGLEERAHG